MKTADYASIATLFCVWTLIFQPSLRGEDRMDSIHVSGDWLDATANAEGQADLPCNATTNIIELNWGHENSGFMMAVHSQKDYYNLIEPIMVRIVIYNVSAIEKTWVESEYSFKYVFADLNGNALILPKTERYSNPPVTRRVHLNVPPGIAIEYNEDVREKYILDSVGYVYITVSGQFYDEPTNEVKILKSNQFKIGIQ